jgi:hypothetical protein
VNLEELIENSGADNLEEDRLGPIGTIIQPNPIIFESDLKDELHNGKKSESKPFG